MMLTEEMFWIGLYVYIGLYLIVNRICKCIEQFAMAKAFKDWAAQNAEKYADNVKVNKEDE